jgi:hypothetical protein
MKRFLLVATIFGAMTITSSSAQNNPWHSFDSLYKYVQPVASIQFFSTYTMGEKVQLTEEGPLERVEDRLNFSVRRARFGFKGKPYQRLSYTVMVQYDNIGRDKYSGTRGSGNTGQLGILDAYFTYRVSKSDIASVTVGYFHPQFSRECITGDLVVNSFDKSYSQGYIRQHITGKGYGRTTGINLGGIKRIGSLTLNYNVGLFNNNTTAEDTKANPETAGRFWSPLIVDRVTISIGDPDIKTYAINYGANNFFDSRKGLTIGFNSSRQGHTEIFNRNSAIGVDLMLNYKHLNLDGEWNWLERKSEGAIFKATAGHARLGYNMIVGKKVFLEPVFMVTAYHGDEGSSASGYDEQYNVGLNWYFNKQNGKISLHYVLQQGQGDNGFTDEETFQKGDIIGMGLVLII